MTTSPRVRLGAFFLTCLLVVASWTSTLAPQHLPAPTAASAIPSTIR